MADSDLCLIIDLGNEWGGINTSRQLAALQQFGIDGDVFVVRIHVLHAGDAERGGMSQSAFHSRYTLLVCDRRDDFVDQVLGRVFLCASRISLRVADDDSSGRIGGL